MSREEKVVMSDTEKSLLSAQYEDARAKYKPRNTKLLLIAEAPPCNLDRYFYYEDVQQHDSLFLEVMGVLYPEEKADYLKSKRDPERKAALLKRFQSDGFQLIDLSELPTSITKISEETLSGLMKRVSAIANAETLIVLIKSNVYDISFQAILDAGYRVSDLRLPFPGSGQQRVFRELFARAIEPVII